MINKIKKMPGLKRVLHIDLMCNAGPFWSRQIAGMSECYTYISSDNVEALPGVLTLKPTHIVLGGGFWNSKIQEESSKLLIEYLDNNECNSFSYWGDGRLEFIKEPVADIVFCSSVEAVGKLNELNTEAEFAVHPVETELYYPDDTINKIYDWNYIGTNYGTDRQIALDMLKKLPYNGIIRGQGHNPETLISSFEQTANIFRQSKITININNKENYYLNKYFSDRLLMAMFCKSFNLITKQPGLEELFIPGVDLDTFSSDEELKEKLEFYLNNPEKVKEMTESAFEKVQPYSIRKMIPEFFEKSNKIIRNKQ